MKHYNLLSSGLSLLIALILLGCGILVPSALLELQENQILQRKRMYPIEVQELEGSGQNLSSSKEYQALFYRLLVWDLSTKYQMGGKALEAPEEYELSRENAAEKSKQEFLRLAELGACPNMDFESFSLSEATLMGAEVNSSLLDELKVTGVLDVEQIDLSQRVSRWTIVWKHKSDPKGRITITIDAQTGKIYGCEIVKTGTFEFEYGEFLLMFGKYHDLLEFRSEWESGFQDSSLYFNNLEIIGNTSTYDETYNSQPQSLFYMAIQARWFW